MYIVTRTDLSAPQRAVQAIHAAIEAAKTFPLPEQHPNVVLLAVSNEDALNEAYFNALRADIPVVPFHEPDLDNQLTAVASAPVYGVARKHFAGYQLLKG